MTHIVVLSGGLDSTVTLAHVLHQTGRGHTRAVSFDYGQRHRCELDAALAVAAHYSVRHHVESLKGRLYGSALLGHGDVPHGRYDDPSMAATVVTGRNLLFAAQTIGSTDRGDTIWFGVHAGDHPVYADCRPEFWEALGRVADAYGVTIRTPFLEVPKADIVAEGARLGAPLHLTWSCYEGGRVHCGRCGTCVERAEAFHVAGVDDPTDYADPAYWRAQVGV